MTAYSFTGPSRIGPNEADRIEPTLRALNDVTEIITGGAHGWDMGVALVALVVWPHARHTIVVPRAPYAADLVDHWDKQATADEIVHEILVAPPGAGPLAADQYRARNEELVLRGDTLVAATRGISFYRSGEWMTLNMARKLSKPLIHVNLEETP